MSDSDLGSIRITNLAVNLGGLQVLHDVNLTADRGDLLALLGPNGAGKTTILRTMLGLVRPARGSVTVAGAAPGRGWRHVGYVPQQKSFQPGLTLRGRDLVRLGADGHHFGPGLPAWLGAKSRRTTDRIVADSIELMRSEHLADKQIGRMSGGEQQRMRIAQALATDPHLLLCDEPLLSLDLPGQRTVADVLQHMRTAHGTGVMFVTHEINPVLPYCDRVLYLVDGRFEVGPTAEVMTSERLTRLYRTPVDVLHVRDRLVVVGGDH